MVALGIRNHCPPEATLVALKNGFIGKEMSVVALKKISSCPRKN
jgi:hypothetical protein